MKFIVIRPRGQVKLDDNYRELLEFDISKISGYETFIQQQIGRKPVSRKIGDYLFWIADPYIEVVEEDISFTVPENVDLTCNLLINEMEFAFGSVVVTSNHTVDSNEFSGLSEQDVANIMNMFTLTEAILVEDPETEEVVAVDRIFDGLLTYNSINIDTEIDPTISEPIIDDEQLEIEEGYEDGDPAEFDEIEFGDSEFPMPPEYPVEIIEDDSTNLDNESLEIEVED